MNPADRERLLDGLLQLRFGCHPDPDALNLRLRQDPELAALDREAARIATGLSDAARSEMPALALKFTPSLRSRVFAWTKAAAVAAITIALVGPLIAAGWFQWREQRLDDTALAIRLTGPASIAAFAPAEYVVAVPTRDEAIDVVGRVLDTDGSVLHTVTATGTGNLRTLTVPPLAATPARLEVHATSGAASGEIAWDLRAGAAAPTIALTTSQPAYRPGDVIRVRAVALDRLTLEPRGDALRIAFEDPTQNRAAARDVTPRDGIAVAQFVLDDRAPAGTWTVLALNKDDIELARSSLTVASTQAPRLFTTIALDRATYAPGAKGKAAIEVLRASGGAAANATIDAVVFVDGEAASTHVAELDADGKTSIAFSLPSDVRVGDASFAVRVRDGGDVETKAQPFAFALRRLDVRFFPEGGALVAGLPTRVYAEVATPNGRPTAARGRVVDDRGASVAQFDSDAHGRARFALTPELGRSYRLELASPQADAVALPTPRESGVVLETTRDSYAAAEPIGVQVRSSTAQPFTVALFCRGVLIAHEDVASTTAAEVALSAPDSIAGVLRVRVLGADRRPLAERLVHRKPARAVHVALTPKQAVLAPGERQSLQVRTTDESGAPRSAIVGLAVYDHALAELAGRPRQDLYHQTWLFADVDDPEHVGALTWAAPADTGSNLAIDLLLGTRGARRSAAQATNASTDDPVALALARSEALKDGRTDATKVEDTSFALDLAKRDARLRTEQASRAAAIAFVLLAIFGLIALFAWLTRRFTETIASPWHRAFARLTVAGVPALLVLVALSWIQVPTFMSSTETVASIAARLAPEESEPAGGVDRPTESKPGSKFTTAAPMQEAGLADLIAPRTSIATSAVDVDVDAATVAALHAYVHQHRASETRGDFASLLCWQTALATDANGDATIAFDTSDRLTQWDVVADGMTTGRVGFGATSFHTGRPLSIEPVLPTELTEGDAVRLPIAIRSDDDAVDSAHVRVTLGDALRGESSVERLDVALEDGGGRAYVPFTAIATEARSGLLELDVRGGPYADRVTHRVAVVPRGFPYLRAVSGRTGFTGELALDVPSGFDIERSNATLTLYTSPLSELGNGLRGMLREPHGCFEQTSSVNYPNVLALHLLKDLGPTSGDAGAATRDTTKLVADGYARLTSFEVEGGGFEWFGRSPAHEGLTAYGLMQFHDMREVFAVDTALVERTRAWLVSRRDGKGGFERADSAFASFGGASEATTNAYITYALATTGDAKPLALELDALAARATSTIDAYELALCAGALAAAGRDEAARSARSRLAAMAAEDGTFTGSAPSMTGSRGANLTVETTAFAILALAPDATQRAVAARAFDALLSFRKGDGSFGATQATVMALKAILAAREFGLDARGGGRFELTIDGGFAGAVDVKDGETEPVVLDGFTAALRAGSHSIVVRSVEGSNLPFTVAVEGRQDLPDDAADGALRIATELSATQVEEGALTRLSARVTKVDPTDVGMCVAVLGIPAGLELQARELERLATSKAVDFVELRGRDLVVYWRSFGAEHERKLHVDLVARIPGTTTGPASRVAPYYQPERRTFAPPLRIEVREAQR